MAKKKTNGSEMRRLYRSRKDKVIAGVCGGIGEYFAVDPVWVRLGLILLALADGVGVVLYILAWILVPENPSQKSAKMTVAEETVENVKKAKNGKATEHEKISMLGVFFVLLGGALLIKKFWWFDFKFFWATVLILFGLHLIMRRSK